MNNILSIKRTKKLDFSKDEVWNVITTPNYLNETHPFCKNNTVVTWPGVGSKDILEYLSGLTFEREFTQWDENGYVDFEVIKAEEGDWRAVMSYTPHYLPNTPQSIFYATSRDGLDWEFSKDRITEKDFSYLDPTGVPLDNGTYLLVMSGATNEMADPMKNPNYQLFTAQLLLPLNL